MIIGRLVPRTSRTLALAIASVFLSADLPAQVIAGRVIDDRTQQPAVDYVVRLVQTSDRGVVALDETTTDPKGHFTVVAPSAGRYLLSFGRSALRVHRVAVDVEAGAAPTPKDFPLPIQRESDMQPYVDVDVDSARIMTSAGGPAYPNERRQVGEGGSTFAIFVVDTTGHPEINSLRVFAGTHADFARSVEQWLTVGTFGVSHVGNVPVRRQVCLAVSFQLDIDSRRPRQVSRPSVPPAGLANSAKALCSRAVEGLGMITVSAQR
jgi:hypothetical protein